MLTPEELAERKTGLGGSDALAYCGQDRRLTMLELFRRKTGLAAESTDPNPRAEWGTRLEPVVREWLAEELNCKIIQPTQMYRSKKLPMMLGHIDGVIHADLTGSGLTEGVEIKTCDKYMAQEFGDVGTDQVPVRYALQCTHYMIVTGWKRFHLAALVGGNDARHYIIDFDPELGQMLVARARAFWEYVETNTPPNPTTLEDAKKRWPVALMDQAIMATEGIDFAFNKLKEFRDEEQDAKKRADDLEVSIKAFMGEAALLTNNKHEALATWRQQSRERFDEGKFTREHPQLACQYRTQSTFRVFRMR